MSSYRRSFSINCSNDIHYFCNECYATFYDKRLDDSKLDIDNSFFYIINKSLLDFCIDNLIDYFNPSTTIPYPLTNKGNLASLSEFIFARYSPDMEFEIRKLVPIWNDLYFEKSLVSALKHVCARTQARLFITIQNAMFHVSEQVLHDLFKEEVKCFVVKDVEITKLKINQFDLTRANQDVSVTFTVYFY